MSLRVQLDSDVAQLLRAEASIRGVSFDVLGNQLIRGFLLPTTEVATIKTDVVSGLPPDWFFYKVAEGVDPEKPGLYEWSIEGRGCYIGKYTRGSRPTRDYERNLNNILAGKSYRPANPNGYRRIHRELKEAHLQGRKIILTILENVDPANLLMRERILIAERGTLNGKAGGRVL